MSSTGCQWEDGLSLLSEACRRLGGERPAIREAIERLLEGADGRAHLVVMNEPYLSLLLEGRKTVESRFSRRRVAPFGEVKAGDVLLLKSQGGPVVAIAEAAHAESFRLDPSAWEMLKNRYAQSLCAQGQAFWEERAEARYATLIRIAASELIAPFIIEKRDRRAWVVLNSCSEASVRCDQLELGTDPPKGDLPAKNAPRLDKTLVPFGRQLALLN